MRRLLLVSVVVLLLSIALPSVVSAQNQPCKVDKSGAAAATGNPTIPFTPEIPILELFSGEKQISGASIGEYIRSVFVLFIWTVGGLAVIMVVFGGVKWIAAAGNPGRIQDARETVTNAIIGLILALSSIVFLNTINPALTNFSSLSVKPVSPCVINFLSEIVQESGTPIESAACPSAGRGVVGAPDLVCAGSPPICQATLNTLINNSARKYSVDAVLLKALIFLESPKHGGSPLSGPTTLPDGTGSGRRGSAYGLGQIIADNLKGLLQEVIGSIPAACSATNLRQTSGPANGALIPACAQYLDQHLQVQTDMMALLIKQVKDSNQTSSSPTVLALIYHLGQGGYNDFLSGQTQLTGTTRQQAIAYAQSFNRQYRSICQESGIDRALEGSPGGL